MPAHAVGPRIHGRVRAKPPLFPDPYEFKEYGPDEEEGREDGANPQENSRNAHGAPEDEIGFPVPERPGGPRSESEMEYGEENECVAQAIEGPGRSARTSDL
jgi:hypothetical protein